ncbi:MAG: DUF3846 domain-containing protein [Clostridia bacterium]|nr:DUF3846 domain-containing protein [Clostridia bacterium]
MQVLALRPGQPPQPIELENSLTALQCFVGGYIEVARRFPDGACLICNEEGKLLGLSPNRYLLDARVWRYDYIAGDALICGSSGEEFTDLTPWQEKKYEAAFQDWIPEEDYAD